MKTLLSGAGPAVTAMQADDRLVWFSDDFVPGKGWKICAAAGPSKSDLNLRVSRASEEQRLFKVRESGHEGTTINTDWESHRSCVLGSSESHHFMAFQERLKVHSVKHM